MDTRQINTLSLSDALFKREARRVAGEQAARRLDRMSGALGEIRSFTEALLQKGDWVQMRDGLFYSAAIAGLFPDFSAFPFGRCPLNRPFDPGTVLAEFGGRRGGLLTAGEFQAAFGKDPQFLEGLLPVPAGRLCFTVDEGRGVCRLNNPEVKKWGGFSRGEAWHIPVCRLRGDGQELLALTPLQTLCLWLRYSLIPRELPDGLLDDYRSLSALLAAGKQYFSFGPDRIELNYDTIKEAVMELRLESLNGEDAGVEAVEEELSREAPLAGLTRESRDELIKGLLECDTVRCDIESYDEKILSDPNRGHWDLWDEPKEAARYTVKLENGMIARNPLADVNYDGVIGIDFGTKSTVVVYQENTEHTLPMRIGTGRISKKVEARHYENPTVMEMIDLDRFLAAYFAAEGRPETLWKDLVISHTANGDMLNSVSGEYYSFFNELKQWAGDKRRQIRLKDKQNKDILLPPFADIAEGEFNPIEIYAYYIGLYINNMHNGIYLDYVLSFPVTYETAVRKKITESFERGLKKSLPLPVLHDEAAMKRFRVSSGISEPAAYAICALEDCYSDLDDDEKIYYGIFDFGGGTTDFDYGVWRETDGGERKYDYVLECFGAGGDQYLGGENLLELLAFEVFKENQDLLRTERVSFVLPPECKKFPGSEVLLSESQEAKLNMRQLMEALRPFWEQQDGYEALYQDGAVKLTLFTKEGEARPEFELAVSMERMDSILRERIRKGVVNFFEGLKAAFASAAGRQSIQRIDIFLAGNSSRSRLVTELFDEYIGQYASSILPVESGKAAASLSFTVHPPLGFTAGSPTRLDEEFPVSGDPDDLSYITRPNGKTGVAFGLIEGRPGGRIKVVLPDLPKDSNGNSTEIKFQYFIGYKKKNCFRVVSGRDVPYGEWILLYDASVADFTIYYTSLPEALTNRMSILDVSKKNCRLLKAYPDADIYYRPVSPTVIEYVVTREDGLLKGEYLEDAVRLELS